jgi:hypothetical protein
MRKYGILVAMMAFVLAFTSSCGLIVKDAAVDAQTVIIDVAGKTFDKTEVKQAIANVMDYQEYMYSYYGATYDRTDADTIASAQKTAINALIEEAVTQQKIKEYGLDQFTDEELAALNETVNSTYDSNASTVKSYYFADSTLTGADLDAAVEAKMQELGYGTRESLLEKQKLSASTDKLKAMVVKDVAVTEDEIQAEYNNNVAKAITTYASTPTQYASDVSSGSILYYAPAGYRYVKNLLIKIKDEDKTTLTDLATQITDKQTSLEATKTAIGKLPEDPTTDTEDQAKSRVELTQQSDTLTADIVALTKQQTELTQTAYAAIQPKVDEVLAKISAGENFDALVAEYGEDPGMQSEPTKSTGYLVSSGLTTYIEVFINEAMALKKIGDISEPFRSDSGVHILQYASDLQSGQVALSAIHDQVQAELLSTKQNSLYDETLSQWVTDAKAKTYPDKLKD